jgi:hypothetical protein
LEGGTEALPLMVVSCCQSNAPRCLRTSSALLVQVTLSWAFVTGNPKHPSHYGFEGRSWVPSTVKSRWEPHLCRGSICSVKGTRPVLSVHKEVSLGHLGGEPWAGAFNPVLCFLPSCLSGRSAGNMWILSCASG